jgi:hypothetical protein
LPLKEAKPQVEVSDEDFFLLVRVLIRALRTAAWLLERFLNRATREELRREVEEDLQREREQTHGLGRAPRRAEPYRLPVRNHRERK